MLCVVSRLAIQPHDRGEVPFRNARCWRHRRKRAYRETRRLAGPAAFRPTDTGTTRCTVKRTSWTVSGAAVGRPGEGVRSLFSLTGTKETAP